MLVCDMPACVCVCMYVHLSTGWQAHVEQEASVILTLETLGKVRVMLKYTQAQTLAQSIPFPALECGWAPQVLLCL